MNNVPYNPRKHHRRSIRLKGYDYSQPGAYFVTICSYNREPIFGEIVDGNMVMNKYGRIYDYIQTNPARWQSDKENPDFAGEDDFERWLGDIQAEYGRR